MVISDVFGEPAEFDGLVIGTADYEFKATFDFTTQSGADMLLIDFGLTGDSGESDELNFHVIFSDLDWDGEPNRILTGLHLAIDDNVSFGQGFSGTVDDHSFTLTFDNYFVDGFRSMEIELLTTIDSTSSNPDPVPVPPAVGLGLMGMGLVGLTRRSRQNNKKV